MNVQIRDNTGALVEVNLDENLYSLCAENGMTASQYINTLAPVAHDGPSVFDQMLAASGLVVPQGHHPVGRQLTLHDMITGKAQIDSAIVRPDGSARNTPAGRILFPALLLEILDTTTREDTDAFTSAIMGAVGSTLTLGSPKYDQVTINWDPARNSKSMPISQLAEPQRILTFTTGMVSRSLPTWAAGIEISKEAQQATTIDQVGNAFREMAAQERADRMTDDILGILNGNTDAGEAGVIGTAITAQSLDAAVTVAGTITQKAWVKFLMRNYKLQTLTHLFMNIDTYLAVEGRANRPVKEHEPAQDERLNSIPRLALNMIPAGITVIPMEDMPANTILGLQQSRALRRVVYTGAEYTAVQEWVMRKSTAFRVDHSERIESTGIPNSFSVMTLTV